MKDRIGRFVVLRFVSNGCSSESSVDVMGTNTSTNTQPKKPKPEINIRPENQSVGEENTTRSYFGLANVTKTNISSSIQRMIRSLKSFTQFFVYKDEMEEMEIGYPTDVKHVTHIGLDGVSDTSNPVRGWENLTPPEMISFPPISLTHFELAMSAQAASIGSLPVDMNPPPPTPPPPSSSRKDPETGIEI